MPGQIMADPLSDEQQLLRQLGKGNEAAFSTLYDRYQGPIYRFALHMSGNQATAEEVTQDVFMALITSSSGYQPDKGSLAAYLFGIARNLTYKTMDRRFDSPLVEELAESGEDDPASDLDVLAELSRTEMIECLRKAVLALPEQYREVVVLCELEEMSYEQARAILNCSAGTIASRLHRAKAALKTRLKGQGCLR